MNTTKRVFRRSVLFVAVVAAFAVAAAGASAAPLAYTANYEGNSVSVIDTATNTVVGAPIPVGEGPYSIAVTPDGKRLYVANINSEDVSVIDTASGKPLGAPIELGGPPETLAISPDGRTVYATLENADKVAAIDTATDLVSEVEVFEGPSAIAVSPDGKTVWVTSTEEEDVHVLDPKTLKPVGEPIPVASQPYVIAFAPDGKTAYVSNEGSEEVSAIDTATRKVTGIKVGSEPWGLGITPDGKKMFVANYGDGTVSVVDTATGTVIDGFEVGTQPYEFGMAPNGKVAYLAEYGSEDVLAIDTQTDKVLGKPIELAGLGPWQVVVTPDQSPTAAFTAPAATATVPAAFSGAASTDPDGSVVSWNWAFGDGGTGSGVNVSHTYAQTGNFGAKLSVLDNEGCGEAQVFTGRTAYCSGNVGASVTHPVTVKAPPVVPIATPAPSNNFRFGRIVHNLRNGTVRIQVKLPSAGFVLLAGPKVHAVTRKSKGVQSMWLTVHARVRLAKQLKKTLRAPVKFRVTFTPNGGTPKTVNRSVTLQRAPQRKHSHRH